MIKRFFLISFLALASLALFAQQNANGIRGIVVEEDGTPVMYASVAMIQNGKAAAGALTDMPGPSLELSCRLEAGGCAVRASPGRLGSLAQPQRRGTSP